MPRHLLGQFFPTSEEVIGISSSAREVSFCFAGILDSSRSCAHIEAHTPWE